MYIVELIIFYYEILLSPIGVLAPQLRMVDGVTRPPINMSGHISEHVTAK